MHYYSPVVIAGLDPAISIRTLRKPLGDHRVKPGDDVSGGDGRALPFPVVIAGLDPAISIRALRKPLGDHRVSCDSVQSTTPVMTILSDGWTNPARTSIFALSKRGQQEILMRFISNPHYGHGLPSEDGLAAGEICTDAKAAQRLFGLCPAAHVTPLTEYPDLAGELGLAAVHIKDERGRMGLGSFKSLGAAHAIAKTADAKVAAGEAEKHETALKGTTYICASAGNHGLSMAAGARVFGAAAVVYLSETVPEAFAQRLRQKEATVVRAGETYEESMAAAMAAADDKGWNLLSDSSWVSYTDPARDVMEGYLIMGMEVAEQLAQAPTHIFLQAGVGGLAAACTAAARTCWGADPVICVVEPDAAPALMKSIVAGKAVVADGPVSNMGRLDCKEPSHLALKYLAREANAFMVISDEEAVAAVERLEQSDLPSTPSGVAGLAGLQYACNHDMGLNLDQNSRVLLYVSEGPEDDAG